MDKTAETVATFNKYANQYELRYRDYQPYLSTYAGFAELIDDGHRSLLDVACGPASFSSFLVNRFPGLQVTGIDLAPAMIELARKNLPGGQFHLLDCRQLASLNTSFDILLLGFCLPYLDREEADSLLAGVADCLNERGLLYLSAIEGNYQDSTGQKNAQGDRVHTYYYSAEYLIDRLKIAGLSIVHTSSRPFRREDGSEVNEIFLYARKESLPEKSL